MVASTPPLTPTTSTTPTTSAPKPTASDAEAVVARPVTPSHTPKGTPRQLPTSQPVTTPRKTDSDPALVVKSTLQGNSPTRQVSNGPRRQVSNDPTSPTRQTSNGPTSPKRQVSSDPTSPKRQVSNGPKRQVSSDPNSPKRQVSNQKSNSGEDSVCLSEAMAASHRPWSSVRRMSLSSRESSSLKGSSEEEQGWLESHHRQGTQFHARALRCLELEDISNGELNITRQGTLTDIVAKQRKHKSGCLELPLNIIFFLLFAISARLHEDITNVWFIESAFRRHVGAGLQHVNSIDDLWGWMKTDLMSLYFVQKDYYGEELPETEWSRVFLYSQLQGTVKIEQSRDNGDTWGSAYDASVAGSLPAGLVQFDAENRGFTSKAESSEADSMLPIGGRRLSAFDAMWMSGLLVSEAPIERVYDFMLHPSSHRNLTLGKINYLESRRWLDEHTQKVKIVALMLNAEFGRPRLEQVTITFFFSRGGGIYHLVELEALFLAFWPKGAFGLFSMGIDFLWVSMLVVSSWNCWRSLWHAFLESKLNRYIFNSMVSVEFFIMGLGWLNLGGWMIQIQGADKVKNEIKSLHDTQLLGSEPGQDFGARLHKEADDLSGSVAFTRTFIAWMTLVLMLRFFSSFRVQPRLAVVTNSLKAVFSDLMHFLVVFSPTFFAYAICGHFLFGRRVEGFSTVHGSIGVCLRIAFENEYEWLELSHEFYSTAAIWSWTYLIFVVFVMINMVIAIVLDVYNEVRSNTETSHTIFNFLSQVFKGARNYRHWVTDDEIASCFQSMDYTATVHPGDFAEALPQMRQVQMKMLMQACADEMVWQAKQELISSNYLKLGASIKLSVDEAHDKIKNADAELHSSSADAAKDAEKSNYPQGLPGVVLATPRRLSGQHQSLTPRGDGLSPRMVGVSRAFPGMVGTPGGYAPLMCAPNKEHPNVVLEETLDKLQDEPEWYRDLRQSMQTSTELMDGIQDAMRKIHWEWHHLECRKRGRGDPASLKEDFGLGSRSHSTAFPSL